MLGTKGRKEKECSILPFPWGQQTANFVWSEKQSKSQTSHCPYKTLQSYSHHQSQDPVPAGGPETFSGAHTSLCWLLDKYDQRKAALLFRNTIRYNRTLFNMKNVSSEASLIPNTQVRDVGPCSRPTPQILVCHLPPRGQHILDPMKFELRTWKRDWGG